MKYSFNMAYLKLFEQLKNTLVSFQHHYADREDFEVVLAIDPRNPKQDTEQVKELASKQPFRMLCFESEVPAVNPAPLHNLAAKESSGDFFIINGPEMFHKSDVLSVLDRIFQERGGSGVYVIFACESGRNWTPDIERFEDFKYEHHCWYQHSVYRNRQLNFCSAISKSDWKWVGGFDEDFKDGIAFHDDNFRDRVLAYGISIVVIDEAITVHQKHDKVHLKMPDYKIRHAQNKALREKKMRELRLML